jgi:hypothetical protein
MEDTDHGFTTSPGTWDVDPVQSNVRFRVFVPVGGFVSSRLDELRGRVAVDEDGAIHAEGAATPRASTLASVSATSGCETPTSSM